MSDENFMRNVEQRLTLPDCWHLRQKVLITETTHHFRYSFGGGSGHCRELTGRSGPPGITAGSQPQRWAQKA